MSNIIPLPPNKESGLYHAPSHEQGGVQVIVDEHYPVEVEGGEIQICRDAMQSDEVHEFNNVTNKELLDEIFKVNSCVFEQGKADSGDFIICKLVVDDKKKRNIKGTVKEIINKLQSEKACNVTESAAERVNRQGGNLSTKEQAKIRLDALKAMQRRKPSKKLADKIRVLQKEIRDKVYSDEIIPKKIEAAEYRPELIATHNLTYANLLFSDKLGGISMPSLAIVKITNPLTGFGDITLVAPKDFIDPQKNKSSKIFNRDIYSPTYPTLYSNVDKSALVRLKDDLYKRRRNWNKYVIDETGNYLAMFIEDIERGRHLPDVLDYATRNPFMIYLWAFENNIEIDIPLELEPFGYWVYNPDTDVNFILDVQQKYPTLYSAVINDSYDFSNDELRKELSDSLRENFTKNKIEGQTDKELIKLYKKELQWLFDEDGIAHHDYQVFKELVVAINQKKRIDTSIWGDLIRNVGKENFHAIREFTNRMIEKVMSGSYFFKNKTSKVHASIDSIYNFMSGKSIKSSQDTLAYGHGKAASLNAKQYDSLIAVARDKEHYTVTKEVFEDYEKKQNEIWNEVLSKIRQYHNSGNGFNFNALDSLSKAMGQMSQFKNPTDEKISQILSRNEFGKTPSYVYDVAREFASCLRNAPAEYFEIKMDGIVSLNSFIGAVVPKELSEDAVPLLNKHGITNIVFYTKGDYQEDEIKENVSNALEEVVQKSKSDILFKSGGDVSSSPTKDKELIGMHLPVEMSVYVPSTKDANVPVSKNELEERVNIVREYLANLFGGFSSSDVIGGYVSNSKELIKEDVVKVIAFATKDAYTENKEKLAHQIAKWAREWSQEAIGFELEGDLYYINQEAKQS